MKMLTRVFLFCILPLISFSLATSSSTSESGDKSLEKDLGQLPAGKSKVSPGNPRFVGQWYHLNSTAFNFLPNINPGNNPAGTGGTTGTGGVGSGGFLDSIFSGNTNFGVPGTVGTVGASAVLIKGGFLTLLTAVKSIVVPVVLTLLLIAFLLAGAAFFTCSLVDCQGNLGSLTRGGGGLSSLLDDRNSIDNYERFRPVFQAIDEGNQKYGKPLKGHGNPQSAIPGQ